MACLWCSLLVVELEIEGREGAPKVKVSLNFSFRSNSRRLRSKGGSSWLHWVLFPSLHFYSYFAFSHSPIACCLLGVLLAFSLNFNINSRLLYLSTYLSFFLSLSAFPFPISLRPNQTRNFQIVPLLIQMLAFSTIFCYVPLQNHYIFICWSLSSYTQGEDQQQQKL